MAKTQLVTTPSSAQVSGTPTLRPLAALNTSEFNPVVGSSIDDVRGEIDDAFEDMKTFVHREPDEIMRMAGGHSARLSEIRVKIMRVEDYRQEWRSVRAREVEPALEELQRQYTIASRLQSVRELDWRMEAGER